MKRRIRPPSDDAGPAAKKPFPEHADGAGIEDLEEKRAAMSSLNSGFQSKTACLKELMLSVMKSKASSPQSDLSVGDMRRQGVVLLSALKQVNKTAQEQVKERREAVQESKRRVDSLQLQLQNLHYQVQHLKHEAAKCLDFETVDQSVNLIPEAQFLEKSKGEGKDMEELTDDHQLMLARLQDELEQRKGLVSQRSSMSKSRDSAISEIKELKVQLAGLRPGLNTLLKATEPVQIALQSSFTEQRQVLDTARHLPEPLYVLFAQLQAYAEVQQHGTSFSVSVQISGDVEAGKKISRTTIEAQRAKFLHCDSESDKEGGEDDEGRQHRKSKRRRTNTNEDQRQTMVLMPHPMSVVATVVERGCGSIEMSFRYLSMLNVVVVQAKPSWQATPVHSCSSLLTPSGLLSNLIEEDDGTKMEGSIATQVMKAQHMGDFGQYTGDVGLAYGWLQRLSGLSAAYTQDNVEACRQLEVVVSAVRSRIDSRFALLQQLTALEQCEVPIRGNSAAFFPSRLSNKLISFTHVREPMTYPWVCLSSKSELIQKTDLCYMVQLERKTQDRAQMHAAVFISQNYPRVTPLFIVHLVNSPAAAPSSPSSLSQSTALRSIEKELNIHYKEMIDSEHDDVDILGLLTRRLQMCFDVLMETEPGKAGEMAASDKHFLLSKGGRDHCRAFRYHAMHQVFLPR